MVELAAVTVAVKVTAGPEVDVAVETVSPGEVGAGPTISVSVSMAVPIGLVAVIVTVVVPTCVGVPLIWPVVVLNVRPGGRLPVVIEYVGLGLPVAVTV